MEFEDRRLLTEIHGTISGIKPVLEANTLALKELDMRQRRADIVAAEHGVKIERLQNDLDGLGRKVRVAQSVQHLHRAQETGKPAGADTKWITFLEFLVILPKYGHVLLGIAGVTLAAVSLLLRYIKL